ncbi:MAG TPA: EF-hand domain-containing protein [Rudaea sp.]|nr:EF-hand domain-containing protein [Rudaea sp.]
MKTQQLVLLAAAGTLVAGAALAQDQVTRFTARDGTQVTLHSGQPSSRNYGPAPAFDQLDTNHDGSISRDEAAAFVPLLNDFDFMAHHRDRISKGQYLNWTKTQYRE